jgi:hypothetical protein
LALGAGVAGLILVHVGCGSPAAGSGSTRDPSRWGWLAEDGGTYWYVPAGNLLAFQWNADTPQSPTPIDDQTVWHIERYENGYFFGPVAAQFAGYPRVCQYATGSVTPDGRVYISFTSVKAIPLGTPAITTGIGKMVRADGEWTFNMQMASGSETTQVTHWAFMLQCRPEEPCWTDLPGVDQTLPQLLASCGGG